MQDDIVVKKPPVSTETETGNPDNEVQFPEETVADTAPQTQVIDAAIPKSSVPAGIIVLAIFICLCLISVVVYGTLSRS